MEKKPSDLSQLFCPVKGKPMQFAIILKNILNVECERVLRHIEEKGGEFMGFDPKGNEYIVLASSNLLSNSEYELSPNQVIFDIKYVKRCVKEKKLLDLNDFQLNGQRISGPRCISFQKIVEEDRCRHFQTAESILAKIKSLKVSKDTGKTSRNVLKENFFNDKKRKVDVEKAHREIKKQLELLARQAENQPRS